MRKMSERIGPKDTTRVSVTVTNTGKLPGDQVVPMYIHHPIINIAQSVILWRVFRRVYLEPDASTIVTFDVGPERIDILNANMKKIVEPGRVDVMIGFQFSRNYQS